MSHIKILGAQGSRSDNAFTTCIQVTKNTLIDAGNIMNALGKEALHVNNIFFSHAHLDHIVDTAFLIDNFFSQRSEPLRLYGLPETLKAIREHIFNWDIWPDFTDICLIGTEESSIVYVEIEFNQRYEIEEGVFLTPLPSNHTVPCCGYLIEKENHSIVFSADSFKNQALWDLINTNKTITSLIIDVSFPNYLSKVAKDSKHLTPAFLGEELLLLQRKEVKIYINHIKPFYQDTILTELEAIGITQDFVLCDGETIDFKTGSLQKSHTKYTINEKIKKLNRVGTALSAEENLDSLLEMIVSEAKSLTNADGGTLYLMDDKHLRFKVVQTDSLGIKMGGTSGEITWPPLPLYLEDGTPNKKMVAATCALEDRLVNILMSMKQRDFHLKERRNLMQVQDIVQNRCLLFP